MHIKDNDYMHSGVQTWHQKWHRFGPWDSHFRFLSKDFLHVQKTKKRLTE
jgi:hypothetical protein